MFVQQKEKQRTFHVFGYCYYICLAEMRRFSADNNNFPYDNNVLVLDMVLGSLWGVPQPINWDNVAKLVPGFTPKEVTLPKVLFIFSVSLILCLWQCALRFEELKTSGAFPHLDNECNALTEGTSPSPDTGSSQRDTGDGIETGGSQSTSNTPGQSVSLPEKNKRHSLSKSN